LKEGEDEEGASLKSILTDIFQIYHGSKVPLLAVGGFKNGDIAFVDICGSLSAGASRVVAATSLRRPMEINVPRTCPGVFF